eukprot:gene6853-7070_t
MESSRSRLRSSAERWALRCTARRPFSTAFCRDSEEWEADVAASVCYAPHALWLCPSQAAAVLAAASQQGLLQAAGVKAAVLEGELVPAAAMALLQQSIDVRQLLLELQQDLAAHQQVLEAAQLKLEALKKRVAFEYRMYATLEHVI